MLPIRKFSRRCVYYCWTSLATAIIIFAFIVSVTRMLIPLLADYRENFETIATEQLGRTVSIGDISAEWIGIWPRIHLSDLNIQRSGADKPWLSIEDVWLSVDILSLISDRQFDAERVIVSGLKLNIHREKEFTYLINGEHFRLDQGEAGDQYALIDWLFSRDRLKIYDSTFSYSDDRYNYEAIELLDVKLSLENDENKHHMYGRVYLQDEKRSKLSLVMDLQGDLLKPKEVTSNFYLKGDIYASRVLKQWASPYMDISDSDIFLELWGEGDLYQMNQIKVRLNAGQLDWALVTRDKANNYDEVDNISGLAFWLRSQDGWRLDIEDFSLKHAGFQWPNSSVHVVYKKEDDGNVLVEGSAGFIRLQDLGLVILKNLPDSLSVKQKLKQLKVRGDISDINFSFRGSNEKVDQFYFNSKIKSLGYNRVDGFLGVLNLDGEVVATKDKGVVRLDGKDVVLDFGKLFPEPIGLNELQGDIYWQQKEEELVVSFDGLKINNDHVQGKARANIRMPDNGESPFMDMQIDFINGIAKYAALYVPRILKKDSQAWIDTAFISGNVSSGRMLYHGNFSDYPFDNNKGTFIVDFDVNDVELNYGDAWPVLKKVDANVLFKDNSLQVSIKKGSVSKIKVLPSVIDVQNLNDSAVLAADMKFEGELQQLLMYMHDSPIGKGSRDFIKAIKSSGNMLTSILLTIPLRHSENFGLKGRTEFKKNEFELKKWKQKFSNINGALNYVYEKKNLKYSSEKLSSLFHGNQSTINVNTVKNKKSGYDTTVTLNGRFTAASLLSPVINAGHVIKGESDWEIKLKLSENDKNLLQVKSDLKGTTISLPDGFSKSSKTKRPVALQLKMVEGDVQSISFGMKKKIKSVFKLSSGKDKKILSGDIVFGNADVAVSEEAGIRIKGSLNTFTPDQWVAVFPGKHDLHLDDAKVLGKLDTVDIKVGEIAIADNSFNNVSLNAKSGTDAFDIIIKSQEIAGDITIPYAISVDDPIKADFKKLAWNTEKNTKRIDVIDPRLLPSLDLKIDKFIFDKKLFGLLEIKMRNGLDGLYFDELSLNGPSLGVEGEGSWLFKQSWHVSNFNLKLKSPRIKDALSLFDIKTSIEEGDLNAQINALWAGPPHWFEMKRLDGNVYVIIKNGRLSDVDPGGGRLFGLLNIKTLRRRLTLDFNDLFKKGFGFDRLVANFNIQGGEAFTKDLTLDGPAAKIEMQGRTGLVEKDYDQVITITPKLSSTFPLLGLAAGPHVAVGLLLTEKLFRKPVNKFSATRYKLTGSWDKPVMKKITENDVVSDTPEPEKENE
ncbi:MAG: TIGR02099 family protein [Gammaproteobacteria bacterium]|nr:TIGR02099 family protein [Gammaproteobacteria bacterium]